MIFLDPKSDIAFKKLFSSTEHANILINFLNTILLLPEGRRITEVHINDPHNHPETKSSKASIVDVRCTDKKGTQYIVEMQVINQEDYAVRAQYYVAVALARQLQQGEDFIKLMPVIFIGIVNFTIFSSPEYLSSHYIVNVATGERTLSAQEYHFIELTKFNKSLDEITSDVDKWIYFFKNAKKLETVPEQFHKPQALQEAFKILEQGNWTVKELESYERNMDIARREKGYLATARNEGLKEGSKKKAQAIAKQLLHFHDSATIAQITGLTIAEVEELKK